VSPSANKLSPGQLCLLEWAVPVRIPDHFANFSRREIRSARYLRNDREFRIVTFLVLLRHFAQIVFWLNPFRDLELVEPAGIPQAKPESPLKSGRAVTGFGRFGMHAIPLLFVLFFQSTPLELMIRTERDFSHASLAKGTRDAFLSFISDNGIIFRPGPVPGKKWLNANSPTAAILSWRPVYADISSAGDLGYTTGPYEYKTDQGTQNGTYLTLWKIQSDGTFKFVVDFGISHPAPKGATKEYFPETVRRSGQPLDAAGADAERKRLLDLDHTFSVDSASNGMIRAFEAWSAEDVRVLRDTRFPAVGKTAGLSLIEEKSGMLTWIPEKAEIADSADLGFTYGKASFKAPKAESSQSGYYLRIWKKLDDGQWKVVVDALND